MAKAASKAPTGATNPIKKADAKRQVVKGNSQSSKQSAIGVGAQPDKMSKSKGKGNNK